jgi:hypothetical protein
MTNSPGNWHLPHSPKEADVNIEQLFPSKYLKAIDLETEEAMATLSNFVVEPVRDVQSGKDEDQPVVHFDEFEKGLILNRTNAESIAALHGRDTEAWAGKRITLFVQRGVHAFNQTWDVIRVRNAVPPAPKELEEEDVAF